MCCTTVFGQEKPGGRKAFELQGIFEFSHRNVLRLTWIIVINGGSWLLWVGFQKDISVTKDFFDEAVNFLDIQ